MKLLLDIVLLGNVTMRRMLPCIECIIAKMFLIVYNFPELFCLFTPSENLSKDLYLMSQMDSDQFIPIWTIANMEGIKKLTTNMDLIVEVLRCASKSFHWTYRCSCLSV